MKNLLLIVVGGIVSLLGDKIYFLSTQFSPIQEAEWVRRVLLPPFEKRENIKILFLTADYGEFQDRLKAEFSAKKGKISLVLGLHSDFDGIYYVFTELQDEFRDFEDKIISEFVEVSKIKGKRVYIPYFQGTYLFAVNKKALKYLPDNVNIDSLNYEDLLIWVENIYKNEGSKKFGLPAGPRGLIHRFIHGYLYPSFTGFQIKKFNSKEGIEMWSFFKELWRFTNPGSSRWESMDTPLLTEEVWIAWDHISRLKLAVSEKKEQFILIPSPRGPNGRGIIIVLAGLGIPESAPNKKISKKLLKYLLKEENQIKVLKGTGFFPVLKEFKIEELSDDIKLIAEAVKRQSSLDDIIVSFIPGGLGKRAGEFSKIYRDAFFEIVIKNREIKKVLEFNYKKLINLFKETKAQFPLPDSEN